MREKFLRRLRALAKEVNQSEFCPEQGFSLVRQLQAPVEMSP
jgi:hypothetical protein